MLRALLRPRGLLALLALSAFLLCALPPHHSQAEPPAPASESCAPASSSSSPPASSGVQQPGAVTTQEGHGHDSGDVFVCHNADALVMEQPALLSSPADLLGLPAAALVVVTAFARLRPCLPRGPSVRRPLLVLSGFPLLLSLGVSRT